MKFRCDKCGHQVIWGRDTKDALLCRGCGEPFHIKKQWEKKVEHYLDNEHVFWYGLFILALGVSLLLFDKSLGWPVVFVGSWFVFMTGIFEYFGWGK